MKSIKTLGLLAVAAMAIAAFVGTSSASAAAKFTTSQQGASLSETTLEEHIFTVTNQQVKCDVITMSGTTAASGSTTQTVQPTYESCEAFGFTATVNTAGCSFTFAAATNAENHASATLSGCTAGGITITVNIPFIAKCKVEVKNQTVTGINYSNTASDIDVTVTAKGIHAEVTEDSGACPLSLGTHTDSTYTGKSTVQAEGATISHDAT